MFELSLPRNPAREYQLAAWDYFIQGGNRAVMNYHRRSGKDLFMLNWMAFCICMPNGFHPWSRVGTYWHVFPEFNHGKRAIWDTTLSHADGSAQKYLEAFPEELIDNVIQNEMKIIFKNGSIYQIVGSDDPTRLRGANPVGVVFSEYAFMNPAVWTTISPILRGNKGWAAFVSTPLGNNHFAKLYEYAKTDPTWFAQTLTVEDTWYDDQETGKRLRVVTDEEIENERRMASQGVGDMDEAKIRQEYYCDFNAEISGAYYANQVEYLKSQSRICEVPYDPVLPVMTSWDIGHDTTIILFWQTSASGQIKLIDGYENYGEGFAHYVGILKQRDYQYSCHFFPHDVQQREMGVAQSRIQTLQSLGLRQIRKVPLHRVEDGIEAVRNILPRCWISNKIPKFVEALKTYRKEKDVMNAVWKTKPVHDWSSHWCDALRYFALGYRGDPSKTKTDLQTAYKRFNVL